MPNNQTHNAFTLSKQIHFHGVTYKYNWAYIDKLIYTFKYKMYQPNTAPSITFSTHIDGVNQPIGANPHNPPDYVRSGVSPGWVSLGKYNSGLNNMLIKMNNNPISLQPKVTLIYYSEMLLNSIYLSNVALPPSLSFFTANGSSNITASVGQQISYRWKVGNIFMKLVIMILGILFAFKTLANSPRPICSRLLFPADKLECLDIVRSGYLDTKVVELCISLIFSKNTNDCLRVSIDKQYTVLEINSCAQQIVNDEKIECVANSGSNIDY